MFIELHIHVAAQKKTNCPSGYIRPIKVVDSIAFLQHLVFLSKPTVFDPDPAVAHVSHRSLFSLWFDPSDRNSGYNVDVGNNHSNNSYKSRSWGLLEILSLLYSSLCEPDKCSTLLVSCDCSRFLGLQSLNLITRTQMLSRANAMWSPSQEVPPCLLAESWPDMASWGQSWPDFWRSKVS